MITHAQVREVEALLPLLATIEDVLRPRLVLLKSRLLQACARQFLASRRRRSVDGGGAAVPDVERPCEAVSLDGRRVHASGVAGLETELGGQLNDYFARIRLCLPDGLWNVRCERAWLRIYDCVTDVYRIHSPREDVPTNNDTAILSSLDRKTVAVDTSPVEFYSDAWGCWTEPMTFF